MDSQTLQQELSEAADHLRAGRITEVERICDGLLQADAQCVDALFLLAGAAHRSGRYELTITHLTRCIEMSPGRPVFYQNLADAQMRVGRLDDAIATCNRALKLPGDHGEIHNNLGNLLLRQDRDAEAFDHLRQAVRLAPMFAEAHYNLGRAYQKLHADMEALAAYRRAAGLRPELPQPHYNLGTILQEQGRLPDAEQAFREALRRQPGYLLAMNNLGLVLMGLQRYGEAIEVLSQAVKLKSDYATGWTNLGAAYGHIAFVKEAAECHRKAVALNPASADIRSSLVFTMQYQPDVTAEDLRRELKAWDEHHGKALSAAARPHGNAREPEKRLRIGYISSDLHGHVVGRNVLPLFLRHDHIQFSPRAYCNSTRTDEVAATIRAGCDQWRPIAHLSDDAVADLIRGDGIDILVDLNLHTHGHRLPVLARKPAPIQIAFAGYPGSTGLGAIDYRISDPYLDPPGMFLSAERVMHLPHSFWCYRPRDGSPDMSPPPVLRNGHITFGSLNNPCKVNDQIVRHWGRVLAAAPHSRVLILAWEKLHQDRILAAFASEGVAPDRVQFAAHLPHDQYLLQYQQIDICLDTLPYNGHTTSLDALWMGVPVVTLVGTTTVGRGGLSQLTNLSLPELIAMTPESFVRIASDLAADLPRLQSLRGGLRSRMRQSPLMDANEFARGIEAIYREVWRRWCQGGR